MKLTHCINQMKRIIHTIDNMISCVSEPIVSPEKDGQQMDATLSLRLQSLQKQLDIENKVSSCRYSCICLLFHYDEQWIVWHKLTIVLQAYSACRRLFPLSSESKEAYCLKDWSRISLCLFGDGTWSWMPHWACVWLVLVRELWAIALP